MSKRFLVVSTTTFLLFFFPSIGAALLRELWHIIYHAWPVILVTSIIFGSILVAHDMRRQRRSRYHFGFPRGPHMVVGHATWQEVVEIDDTGINATTTCRGHVVICVTKGHLILVEKAPGTENEQDPDHIEPPPKSMELH